MKIVSTVSYKQRFLAFLIDYLLISLLVIIIMTITFLITGFDISRYKELSAIARDFFIGKVSKENFSLIVSEYSKLVTFPDDIKPDWKKALYNFVTWCLENQNYLHENNKERQLEFLKNSKNKLEKL